MYIVYVKSDILTNWINGPILLGTNVVHLSGVHTIYMYMPINPGHNQTPLQYDHEEKKNSHETVSSRALRGRAYNLQ